MKKIIDFVKEINDRSPQVVIEYQEKLQGKMKTVRQFGAYGDVFKCKMQSSKRKMNLNLRSFLYDFKQC